MVERRELITIFRQISSMMEAGVDIRRIIRVLSAQTENPRLLSLYDELDHDLRMGKSLGDAMERAPDVFSPFAISLVRNSEDPYNTKNAQDLAGTFYRIADFLQKEEEASSGYHDGTGGNEAGPTTQPYLPAPITAPLLTVHALDGLIDRIQVAALRTLTLAAGLLLSLAAVWWSVEVELVERRWLAVTLCSVAALFIGGAGVWVRRRLEAERKREIHCSFCGQTAEESGAPLKQASRFASTAICVCCTDEFARQLHLKQPTDAQTPAPVGADSAEETTQASAGWNEDSQKVTSQPVSHETPSQPNLRALPSNVVAPATNGRTANGRRASQPTTDSEATYE